MITTANEPEASADGNRPPGLVVLDLGNSALHLGVWTDKRVVDVQRLEHGDQVGLAESLSGLRSNSRNAELVTGVIASVVPQVLQWVEEVIKEVLELDALVVGRDFPLPLEMAVRHPESVGVDRVCAAAAAYEKVRGSCAVIDFGTAVTIDLVDDAGVFRGGAILPGVQLQARALGEHAATLPLMSAAFPEQAVGRDTAEAICSGVCHGLVGAVRNLVEEYATQLNHWPHVVATGGDAAMMIEHCDFIDTAVADLCLHGVGFAYVKHLNGQLGDA